MQKGQRREKKVFPGVTGCVVTLLTDVGNSEGDVGWGETRSIWEVSNFIVMARVFRK